MSPPQSGKSFRSLLGVPPSKPTPSDSVFVIVDAQNEYDHGALAIADVSSSRKVLHDVLEKYRGAKGNVVHVVHGTPEGAPVFTPGTELAEEFEELQPKSGSGEKVIHKAKPCSFSDTELHAHLEKLGKKKIVLGGYMAHVCISSTTRIGAELGYDISILRDGIGDRDIPGAKANELVDMTLAELGDVAATVIGSGDL